MKIILSLNRAVNNRILTPRDVKHLSLAALLRWIEFSSLGVRILLSPFRLGENTTFLSNLLIDLQGKNYVSTPGDTQKFPWNRRFFIPPGEEWFSLVNSSPGGIGSRGRIKFFPGWSKNFVKSPFLQYTPGFCKIRQFYSVFVTRMKLPSWWDTTFDMNYFFGRHSTHFKYPANDICFDYSKFYSSALSKKEFYQFTYVLFWVAHPSALRGREMVLSERDI